MNVLPTCMSIHYIFIWFMSEDDIKSPGIGVRGDCKLLGIKLESSVRAASALSSELSLQHSPQESF